MLHVRIDIRDKERLLDLCEALNKKYSGANYNVSSIAKQAVIDRMIELEKTL